METKLKWKIPHGFLIVGSILLFVTILTWIIPTGQFDRVLDEATGKNVVVASSFHFVENSPVGLFKMFFCYLRWSCR